MNTQNNTVQEVANKLIIGETNVIPLKATSVTDVAMNDLIINHSGVGYDY
tara:strand:+ start:1809 stop:1958 length:150 start_codon:yes stop_codon:yes gene_type:complete